jgi:hypothetical protein
MVELVDIGRLTPRNFVMRVGSMLDLAGVKMKAEAFVGIVIVVCASVPLAVFLIMNVLFPQYAILFAFFAVAAFLMLVYGYLALRADERRNKVENILPDFLHLASANVRAGMPIEQALWFAARPEFGLLSQEIEILTKKTYSGEPFIESIKHLSTRFNSRTLERTVNLIVEGMASGGEVAELLEKTSTDLRNLQLLRKEIAGTMLMYVIFIMFASIIGAPVLYALSSQLIDVANFIWDGIEKDNPRGFPEGGMVFMSPQRPGIAPGDFLVFALLATAMTTLMSSLIVAAIQTGNYWNGLKTAPFIIGAGFIVFFVVRYALGQLFKGFLGM